jgi:hypothetical protein
MDFPRRGDGETCLWAWVQTIGDDIAPALGLAQQARPLGQALAKQPVVFSWVPRCQRL